MQVFSVQKNFEAAYKCTVSFGWGDIESGNIKQAPLLCINSSLYDKASFIYGRMCKSQLPAGTTKIIPLW